MIESFKSLFIKFKVSIKLLLFIALSVVIINMSSRMYDYKTEQFNTKVYSAVNENIINTIKLLIKQSQKDSIFDFIVKELRQYDFNIVVLLDEKKSQKINFRDSLPKNFIGNNYVLNKNADKVTMKIIENKGLDYYINLKDKYNIDQKTNNFETIYVTKNENENSIGYIIIMKSLDNIDMDDLYDNQNLHTSFTVFIIFALGLIVYYRNSYKYVKKIKKDNKKLLVLNSSLNEKNDELDFNKKKIANIFHIQPNIMIITDGKIIENANARFLGFFHRYKGGLAEFKQKHKCISEFFEPCDDKNIDTSEYFDSNTIEGIPWKDFILANFKRNYKVCMKDGKKRQHHFIIKMNEMKYAKLVKRYIVVSFIDITNEIVLRKEKQERQAIMMEQTKMAQMGEMMTYISHQWKQPLNTISLAASGMKFKNDVGLLKDGDINNFANDIIENSKFLSDTITDFTNFTKEKIEKTEIDLIEIINTVLKIIGPTYEKQDIKIIKNFTNEKVLKTMIAGELSQAIMSIMTNSKDELVKKEKDKKWIKIIVKKEDNNCIILIEDNAGGIPKNILPSIFKQYFTTKDEEMGTGLGLFISKRLIENNLNGNITTDNTDDGAIFKIKIPLDKIKKT